MVRNILLSICLCFSSNVLSLSLEQQRNIFQEAKELQEQNKWEEADEKLALIPIYPLNYILEYNRLKASISLDNLVEATAFISENAKYKITNNLQRDYLYFLAEQKSWSEFLTFYPELPRTTKLKCLHFQAQIETGNEKEVASKVQDTWLTGYSMPNACDVAFKHYLSNGVISEELIWKRFELAYKASQKALMRYLIPLLKDNNKQLAKQLYDLNINPKALTKSKLFDNRDNIAYPLLKVSIKHLAKLDIHRALQAYDLFEEEVPFTFIDEVELKKYFSFRILIKKEKKLLSWLDANLGRLGDEKLIEQRIRYAIKYSHWEDIEYWINQLPGKTAEKASWVYWQARVLENKKQFDKANALYKEIAGKREYYGFLAAQKIGSDYELNAEIVEPKVTSLRYIQVQLDHIAELHFQKYTSLVKLEWEALLKGRDVDIQRQLGLYAFSSDWTHLSILASIRSKSWNALNIRFPEVNSMLFLENAQKYQIDPSYIYAITRQESAFDQYANSPAGAKGYMQLMPQTAKETARKIGLKNYKGKAQLTDGSVNIQLGTAYFNGLLKRYDGNRVLATAAYNAGPRSVERWRSSGKRGGSPLSMDSWIETIPYIETRNYVQSVLAYSVVYQHVLDKPAMFVNEAELNAVY